MRAILLACIVLALVTSACAENDTLNHSNALQAPSASDETGLGVGFVKAAETVNNLNTLTVTLRDVNTNQSIKNANFRASLDDGQTKLQITGFVGNDGILQMRIEPSEWTIVLMIDVPGTVGKDYYGIFGVLLNTDKNMTVSVQPVGSVRGEVVDYKGMLIQGATVKLSCSGEYGIEDQTYTDAFGSFSADWLPVGPCRISALSGGRTGSLNLNVSQGQLSDVKIVLERNVTSQEFNLIWLVVPLASVAAAVIVASLFIRRKNHKVPKENASPITSDRRMADILSSMDENERKIMEFLMAAGGKSQQNKICRELGLPKSSLSRAIGGLEARNLVKTEKLGRVNRVELSNWFLNGKKQA